MKDKSPAGVPNRLNAAIIVSRLTTSTKLAQLHERVLTLTADESPAVAIWAIKGAGAVLPGYLNLPALRVSQGQKTIDAIVAAAKKHVAVGALVQTAYDQLDLADAKLPADALLMAVDGVNSILAARVSLYVAGHPHFPQADRVPLVFFVKREVLTAIGSNKAKQLAIVQNLVNLLGVSVQRLNGLPEGDAGVQFVNLMSSTAGALGVWFRSQTQPAVEAKFKVLVGLRQPTPEKAAKPLEEAMAAVKALPDYKALTDAPTIK
ncbi:MAG: hypothetical protein QM754_19120 [Tepidisphaeraceae bacterium]